MKKIISIFMLAVFLVACSNSNGTVLTVGDYEATVGEATFVLRELESVYVDQYGENIWNQGVEGRTFPEVVKEGAMDSLTRLYVSKNIAEQNGVTLTDEETADIEILISQYLAVRSEEALLEDGIEEADVRNIFMLNALGEKLMDEEMVDFQVDEARLNADLANDLSYQQIEAYGSEGVLEQVSVEHLLIGTQNDDGSDYTLEEKEAALGVAQSVLADVNGGKSFNEVVDAYETTPEIFDEVSADTFYRGEMLVDFEEASFEMNIGEIRLVESPLGYHIIKKTDHYYPDKDQVATVENYKSYLIEQYTLSQKQEAYDTFYEDWKDDYNVTINESVWSSVKTSNDL